jgi:hypothetical protein
MSALVHCASRPLVQDRSAAVLGGEERGANDPKHVANAAIELQLTSSKRLER